MSAPATDLLLRKPLRILRMFGAECRIFKPSGLPLPDDGADASHPKVAELRDLITWSEGMVWCSPERHGAMTGIMKANRLDPAVARSRAADTG